MPKYLTTVLDILGITLVVSGVALLSIPAAIAVAGMALLLISWLRA